MQISLSYVVIGAELQIPLSQVLKLVRDYKFRLAGWNCKFPLAGAELQISLSYVVNAAELQIPLSYVVIGAELQIPLSYVVIGAELQIPPSYVVIQRNCKFRLAGLQIPLSRS